MKGAKKTPEYVAIVTYAYRRALDCIAAVGDFKQKLETMEDFAFAFNSGITKGYLMGERGTTPFINSLNPNNCGVYAGFVNGVDERRSNVIVKRDGQISKKAEGLVFRGSGIDICFSLNKTPYLFPEGDAYKIPAPHDVRIGS
ncbi:MAG TPA: U32 family peptidase, partial [Methanocorpusculum sp.]|nr:U32 family peptidase [Methanocorpusculum sp.]